MLSNMSCPCLNFSYFVHITHWKTVCLFKPKENPSTVNVYTKAKIFIWRSDVLQVNAAFALLFFFLSSPTEPLGRWTADMREWNLPKWTFLFLLKELWWHMTHVIKKIRRLCVMKYEICLFKLNRHVHQLHKVCPAAMSACPASLQDAPFLQFWCLEPCLF